MGLGRGEEALEAYVEAGRIEPGNAMWQRGRGIALGSLGRGEEALKAYDEAERMEPKTAVGTLGRSIALSRMGRREEARAALDEAKRLNRDGKTFAEARRGAGGP